MAIRPAVYKLSAGLSVPGRRYASTATAASNLPEGLKNAIEVCTCAYKQSTIAQLLTYIV